MTNSEFQAREDLATALNQLEKTLPDDQCLDDMDINYWKSRALVVESESREMIQNMSEMEARASRAEEKLLDEKESPLSSKSFRQQESAEEESVFEDDKENSFRKNLVGVSLRDKWERQITGLADNLDPCRRSDRTLDKYENDFSDTEAEELVKKYLNMADPFTPRPSSAPQLKSVLKNPLRPRKEV